MWGGREDLLLIFLSCYTCCCKVCVVKTMLDFSFYGIQCFMFVRGQNVSYEFLNVLYVTHTDS